MKETIIAVVSFWEIYNIGIITFVLVFHLVIHLCAIQKVFNY